MRKSRLVRRRSATARLCLATLSLLIIAGMNSAFGQPITTRPKGYLCLFAAEPLTIDGRLSESAWTRALWTDNFVDIEGEGMPPPTFRTRVKMLWDSEYLYVAAELQEPHVWATLRQRDTVIFQDNDFEVFIDPNGDNHEYYEFEMNALNTGWDLFLPKPYRDGGPPVDSWDIVGLRTAVHVAGTLNAASDVDTGWSVELAIPWQSLLTYAHCPAPPEIGDSWRINFSRVEWDVRIEDGHYRKIPGRPEHNWVWSPQGVVDMHRPERWGYVQFADDASGLFLADSAWGAKELLMQIYELQRDYRTAHGTWAESLKDLRFRQPPGDDRLGQVTLQAAPDGYEAAVTLRLAGKHVQRWHVRQDSKLWRD